MNINSEPGTSPSKSTQPSLLAYSNEVKARFVNEPDKFVLFRRELEVIGLWMVEAGVIDKSDLNGVPVRTLDGIKDVLEGHRDLLVGLNAFLPEHLQVALDDQGGSGGEKIEDVKVEKSVEERVSEFLEKVKKCDASLHASVSNVLREMKDTDDGFSAVSELLKTNEDLRAEFVSLMDTNAAPIFVSLVQDNNPDTSKKRKRSRKGKPQRSC